MKDSRKVISMVVQEKTYKLPPDLGGTEVTIRVGMPKQLMDILNRIAVEIQFAEEDRKVDEIVALRNKQFVETLRIMLRKPAFNESEYNDPETNMEKWLLISQWINENSVLSEERQKDLKKKQTSR